jgi:hypothetical protein
VPDRFICLRLGVLIISIGRGNLVRLAQSRAKSKAAPATVGGESFFEMPLGHYDQAREGEEGL